MQGLQNNTLHGAGHRPMAICLIHDSGVVDDDYSIDWAFREEARILHTTTYCLSVSLLSSVSVCFLFVPVSPVGLSVWVGWRWLLLVGGRGLLVLGLAACACCLALSCHVLCCLVLCCLVLCCVLCCVLCVVFVVWCCGVVLFCVVLCCVLCAVFCCVVLCCVVLCCVLCAVFSNVVVFMFCCRLCLFVITAAWKKAGLVAYFVGLCAKGNG